MKITSFNPTILTKDMDAVVAVFEALGFQKKHNPTGVSALGNEYNGCRLADANGFHVDVTQTSAERDRDTTAIRMNVDNFDEARDLLKAHGFRSASDDTVTDTGSAKADMLVSPSGFSIALIEHVKK